MFNLQKILIFIFLCFKIWGVSLHSVLSYNRVSTVRPEEQFMWWETKTDLSASRE
jgi:hypothetical protein